MARHQNRQIKKVNYVDPRGYEYLDVDIDVLIPDPENPRIPPQDMSTIDTMLAVLRLDPDGLYRLAGDIVKNGTNPAELLNVTRLGKLFLVKEGNRRVTARKLLRNPEQLRGHVTPRELRRWQSLAGHASNLSTRQLVVVGENHDIWVYRRHQGPQDGVGVSTWGPEARARHAGKRNRALLLADALKRSYPDRFADLPRGTFTTFERIVDSLEGRTKLGLDVDQSGQLKLNRGERSLRILEAIVSDLSRPRGDQDRLTSRVINKAEGLAAYLNRIDDAVDSEAPPEHSLTLEAAPARGNANAPQTSPSVVSGRTRTPDVLKTFNRPTAARLRLIFDELVKVKKTNAANASMVLTRVLLELSADDYARRSNFSFEAGDDELRDEVKSLREFLGRNGYSVGKKLNAALKRASVATPSLVEKLDEVITRLVAAGVMEKREGDAKKRELADRAVVAVLHDAVHRLENFPSIDRVNHILEIVRPIFNGMHAQD
ncbi:MAG: hypothetical protein M3P06_04115 [Acidobacteriota bacterium]|nr:hypothetical protein [Acidobacteriota bacterium]